ncbi:MAG: lamin tail domain-containing protein [Verrucomicrobiales bacterium]
MNSRDLRLRASIGAVLALACGVVPASAAPITVANHSFENQVTNLSAGQFTNQLVDWTGTSGSNSSSAFMEYLTAVPASDGTDSLGMVLNYDVWQDIGLTYQANSVYTLTVGVGNRATWTDPGNQSQFLLADDQGAVYATGVKDATTIPANSFQDAPALVFDTATNPAAVGKPIRVLLRARGADRSHFDNIRLDGPVDTRATVTTAAATNITSGSAQINGSVTNQGLDASLPTVANLAADNITHHSARLRGTVVSTGGDAPIATIYWGTTDGGTNAAAWQHVAPQGYQANNFSEDVAMLNPGTTYYFRSAATNGAGTAWAPATASVVTPPLAAPAVDSRAANGVTATTATLRGEITNDGGSPVTVTFYWGTTDGGLIPANWQNTAEAGAQLGDFTRFLRGLTPNTTYYFRSRATNAQGTSWSPAAAFTTDNAGPPSVVINEIHYQRPNKIGLADFTPATKAIEFIELHNPSASAVDLSGWRFGDGVDFVFPAGTNLPAGGYIVVAQNPTHFQERFVGATALGPWTGELRAGGERIQLFNNTGGLVDEVNYEAGFPWPTGARGGGSSAERIHWSLDPDLGGSWRSSGDEVLLFQPQQFISRASNQWHWRKGTSEPSAAVGEWRLENFVEDGSWAVGTGAFGFGVPAPTVTNTVLSDMRQVTGGDPGYTCIYLRHSFSIASEIPPKLYISGPIDDGAVFWINGNEVARFQVTPVQPAFTDRANNSGSPTVLRTFTINNAGSLLHLGTNVIAVQAFNVLIGNSDFYFDMELKTPPATATPTLAPPTPGAQNISYSPVAPPAVRQVEHFPQQPAAGTPVTITAKITDPDGVGSVQLEYQTVDPGSYIRKTDPAYQTTWTSLAMADDGTNGDTVAGDWIFTVVIPATVQTHRRLVRYRILASDAAASPTLVRGPYGDDEQPNFAYFCYNGVPAWSGAIRPTAFAGFPATPVQNYSSELLSSIQPSHLLANGTDVTNSQYTSSFNGQPFHGAWVYDGVVYDHIQFKNRGIGSTYVSGKNKWNILFNRARDLEPRDNWGRKYSATWNNLPMDANASPWASVHRGSAGVEEALSYRVFEVAGNASLRTHYVHFRVIDAAQESGPTQYDGDFWGLYLALEPSEGNFLDERNLPDGNVYSIEGGGGDKKHQSPTQSATSADWTTFRNGVIAAGQTEAFYRANEDLPTLFTFMAVSRLVGNVDVRPGDNYRYYHRPTDNRWVIFAYDLDMQFIAAHHWGGTMDGIVVAGASDTVRAMMRHPAIALEYRNRCREVLSLLASDPAPNGGQIGQLIDEYAQMVNPSGVPLTWSDADAALWNLHPRTSGGGGNSGQSSHKVNFFRAVYNDGTRGGLGGTVQTGTWARRLSDPDNDGFSDHEGIMQWFTNFSTDTYPATAPPWVRKATNSSGGGADPSLDRQKGFGYKYLEWESLYGGYFNANVNPTTPPDLAYPNKPAITYIGPANYPANDLRFQSSAFSPSATGGTTFAAMQWRLGEISAPGIPFYDAGEPRVYEMEELWTSNELTSFSDTIRVPASAVRTGHTYRARVRHKDANGRWSLWSEAAQFVAGDADTAVYQQNLVVSEVNYHPAAASSAEILAGFGTEAFEFIELKNIGTAALDLTDIQFTEGVDFSVPAGTNLPAGGFALVVKNQAAFEMRYGTSHTSQIIGTFSPDALANGGEHLRLSYGQSEPIRDFTYDDVEPWPAAADGTGPSLTLINPNSAPDHALPSNWRASSVTNGTPGADDSGGLTFATWAAGYPGVTDPNADNDNDGIANRLEYAFGGHPLQSSAVILPIGNLATLSVGGTPGQYLTVTLRRPSSITDLTYTVEFSTDLANWSGGAVLVSSTNNGDGSVTDVYRSPTPVSAQGRWFVHVRVQ